MLSDTQGGRITVLIFQALVQLTRDLDDLIHFSDLFHEANTDLVSLGDGIDTTALTGHVAYTTYMTRLTLGYG